MLLRVEMLLDLRDARESLLFLRVERGVDLYHHVIIPVDFFLGILPAFFEELALLDEGAVLLQQKFYFCLRQRTEFLLKISNFYAQVPERRHSGRDCFPSLWVTLSELESVFLDVVLNSLELGERRCGG